MLPTTFLVSNVMSSSSSTEVYFTTRTAMVQSNYPFARRRHTDRRTVLVACRWCPSWRSSGVASVIKRFTGRACRYEHCRACSASSARSCEALHVPFRLCPPDRPSQHQHQPPHSARSCMPILNHPSAPHRHALSHAISASYGTSTPCTSGIASGYTVEPPDSVDIVDIELEVGKRSGRWSRRAPRIV